MDGLPFQSSDALPNDIPDKPNPIPFTIVNSRPLSDTEYIAPYVPCSNHIVQAALDFATVSAEDVLIDLGCGDGRILFAALLRDVAPKQTIGVELDPYLFNHCITQSSKSEYQSKQSWLNQDMFTVDLISLNCSVSILYLLPQGLDKLKPQLTAWLQNCPKNRVVTINYSIPDWEPVTGSHVKNEPGKTGMWLFLYNSQSIRG
ncbi:hypothetical protein BKA69DRAFT_1122194 [Paraphysoderma sedebokerense]|nr:hypothetical protein BKA69DRAFT_1122194 [Paraphysoderma sedebokerense]